MNPPLSHRFARLAEAVVAETRAYQQLSPDDRLQALFDLIASGWLLLQQSPHRQAGLRQREAQEAEWQRIQKEIFSHHAR
jgi:hypothetical protein